MFNRRLLVDSGGDTSGDGNYGLLVGNFYDPSAGTLCRGYYTSNGIYGDINPDSHDSYPIKSCYAQLMVDESLGLILINTFMLELEGDSSNVITSLLLKINNIEYTLVLNRYSYGKTQYYILLSDNGELFYYLDANINKWVDIKIWTN